MTKCQQRKKASKVTANKKASHRDAFLMLGYSTVTDLARFLGLSISLSRNNAA
jgi:hypothetical protein